MSLIQSRLSDDLTGLPKRAGLFGAMASHIEKETPFSLIYIDINNFKYINNLFGHSVGDDSLKGISALLRQALSEYNAFLARLGGDEFIAMIEGRENQEKIECILQELFRTFDSDLMDNNISIQLTLSMGIVLYPQHGYTCEELLKNANIALYHAKKQGQNSYQLFDDQMKAMLQRKIILQDSLRYALKNGELELYYQPIYKVNNGALRGVEALIRWNNREFGMVSPLEFIPLAEENGTIVPIGWWIIEAAIKKCIELNKTKISPLVVSINISAAQLKQKNFLEQLSILIDKYSVKKNLIEFEITESVFIEDFDYILNILGEIKKLGIQIALDDFGTGYSSLAYLRRLPFDVLKIDRSFVSDLRKDDLQMSLLGSIIDIAHKLDMNVIAEGVESVEQLEIISDYQCEYAQGYLFKRPMSSSDLNAYIESFLCMKSGA